MRGYIELYLKELTVMSSDQIILIIQEQVYDIDISEYSYNNKKNGLFDEKSCLLWTADELTQYILARPNKEPIETVEDFYIKIQTLVYKPKYKNMFKMALNLCENVIDICNDIEKSDC